MGYALWILRITGGLEGVWRGNCEFMSVLLNDCGGRARVSSLLMWVFSASDGDV